MKRPVIRTSLPGPAASKLIDVDKTYVSPPIPGPIRWLWTRDTGFGSEMWTETNSWISPPEFHKAFHRMALKYGKIRHSLCGG